MTMHYTKRILSSAIFPALVLMGSAESGRAQGSLFAYSGHLADRTSGGPVLNGYYDFKFELYTADAGPFLAPSPNTVATNRVPITNGLFTVYLDFGELNFRGEPRWLQISANTNGMTLDLLSPRQPLKPTPYAIYAGSAASMSTSDAQPLDFRVNNKRALRLELTGVNPNIIGGYSGNYGPAVGGATIGGGGSEFNVNSVQASFGTVSGGAGNTASGNYATVGGGEHNTASGNYATVSGGRFNTNHGNYAMIPGGRDNRVDFSASYAFAAGRRAKALHAGAFVWADSQDADVASTANNQFLIRASGGVGIGTSAGSCG
jgi:hypothetical protein